MIINRIYTLDFPLNLISAILRLAKKGVAMGSGFSKMKKQRRALEEQFSKMQEEMQHAEYKGIAGNGLVTLSLTGEKKLKSIIIDPKCVDPTDVEGLEDLVIAAFRDAYEKAEASSPINPNLFG